MSKKNKSKEADVVTEDDLIKLFKNKVDNNVFNYKILEIPKSYTKEKEITYDTRLIGDFINIVNKELIDIMIEANDNDQLISKYNPKELLEKIKSCQENAKNELSTIYDFKEVNTTNYNETLAIDKEIDNNALFSRILIIKDLGVIGHMLGDIIGYKNGEWEFNNGTERVTAEYTNELIYDFISLGGINDFSIENWSVS